MFDQHSPEDERQLNDFWNNLVRAPRAGDEAGNFVDPGLLETTRDLHEFGAGPPPASSREHVRRGVLNTWQPMTAWRERPGDSMPMSMNGWTHVRPTPVTSRKQSAWLGRPSLRYAAAAILILGIVLTIDIIREPGSDRGGAPAIQAPATPSPDASPAGTVFELTLPAEAIPHTHARFIALEHDTILPGTDAHWTPNAGTGPYMEYVVSGSFTVLIDRDVEVRRADGTLDHEPANTEITLFQGDTLISLQQNGMETKNPGTTPAETMNWIFIDDPGHRFAGGVQSRAEGGRKNDTFVIWSDFQLGNSFPDWPGAVTVRLQRLELAPDERVYAPKDGVQLPLTLDVTTESILNAGDGSYFKTSNIKGNSTTTVYLLTLLSADGSGATPAATP